MTYILALDQGTTSSRAIVFDRSGTIVKIAQKEFRFLRQCMAKKEIVLGDARLMLEQEQPKQFDLLAVAINTGTKFVEGDFLAFCDDSEEAAHAFASATPSTNYATPHSA